MVPLLASLSVVAPLVLALYVQEGYGNRDDRVARLTLAWVFNIAFYLIMCWFTYTYASLFGPEETNGWLMSFVLASGNAWLIIEPFEVLLLVMLPFILDNKYVANCRDTAKELGLI